MKYVRDINEPLQTIDGTHCNAIGLAADGQTYYVAILSVETKQCFVEEIIMPKSGFGGQNSKSAYSVKKIENDDEWRAAFAIFQRHGLFDAPKLDKKIVEFWNSLSKKKKDSRLYMPYYSHGWKFARTNNQDKVPEAFAKTIEDFKREYYQHLDQADAESSE